MDVGYREGHVVDAGLTGAIQDEQVVVLAAKLAAQEHAVTRILIADREAHVPGVEIAHGDEVVREQHDVTDLHRLRMIVHRRATRRRAAPRQDRWRGVGATST